jgi:hypothetical protein
VPVIIAFLLKMVLQPTVEMLVGLHLPRLLAALLVLAILLAALCGLAVLLSAPVAVWLAKAPGSLARIETRLASVTQIAHDLQKASQDVEKMGEDAASPPSIAVKGPPLSTFLFSGTRALAAGFLTVVVLLFFLLVSGSSFLRRIVEILPTLKNKKQAVDITYEIQRTVSVYLGTVTLMNAGVGILTGIGASLCGLSDPILWGSLAFLLNYVPILGPLVGIWRAGAGGTADLRPGLAGPVAGHDLSRHPHRRGRSRHPDPAGAAAHPQSGGRDRGPRLLVLDVGCRRRTAGGADAGHLQDHLRPNRVAGGDRPFPRHGGPGDAGLTGMRVSRRDHRGAHDGRIVPVVSGGGQTVEQAKAEERNRTAYNDFLVWLERSMREALRTGVVPSEDDKPQATPADGKSGE